VEVTACFDPHLRKQETGEARGNDERDNKPKLQAASARTLSIPA